MSFGLVRMLLNLSMRQSNGGEGVRILEDFPIYFLRTFVIKLLILRYGFLYLFGGVICCNFSGFVFGFFCHLS
jgi:hypothetical protein